MVIEIDRRVLRVDLGYDTQAVLFVNDSRRNGHRFHWILSVGGDKASYFIRIAARLANRHPDVSVPGIPTLPGDKRSWVEGQHAV